MQFEVERQQAKHQDELPAMSHEIERHQVTHEDKPQAVQLKTRTQEAVHQGKVQGRKRKKRRAKHEDDERQQAKHQDQRGKGSTSPWKAKFQPNGAGGGGGASIVVGKKKQPKWKRCPVLGVCPGPPVGLRKCLVGTERTITRPRVIAALGTLVDSSSK